MSKAAGVITGGTITGGVTVGGTESFLLQEPIISNAKKTIIILVVVRQIFFMVGILFNR